MVLMDKHIATVKMAIPASEGGSTKLGFTPGGGGNPPTVSVEAMREKKDQSKRLQMNPSTVLGS